MQLTLSKETLDFLVEELEEMLCQCDLCHCDLSETQSDELTALLALLDRRESFRLEF